VELHQGAVYGKGLEFDIFLPGGFVGLANEFLVEVLEDGTAEIYVLDGYAEYIPRGASEGVILDSGEMLVAGQGVAALPVAFDASDLDRWWRGAGLLGSGGLLAGLAVTMVAMLVLAAAVLLVWTVARRRRLAPVPSVAPAMGAAPRRTAPAPGQPTAAPPARDWGALAVVQGQAVPRTVPLKGPVVTIGRSSGCDLVLRDGLISRRHAEIRRQDGVAIVCDLASTNGTFVNGVRVRESQPLRPGDRIRLGHTHLIYGIGTELPTRVPSTTPSAAAGQRRSRHSLVLDRPVLTIGRSSGNDLVLVDGLVSRHHAQIRQEGGTTALHDLDSKNGTFVNGQRVRGSIPLQPGDVIRVGQTELVFRPGKLGLA
jgi:pSer/pThr/pTyr-binding forkhead associated (FHA) protein